MIRAGRRLRLVLALAPFAVQPGLARAAEFEVGYADPAGQGFFDETPVTPLDSNPGTTLGEQRRYAFEFAVGVWEAALNSPVPIKVAAEFVELACDDSGAILAAAVPDGALSGFAGAEPGIYYPSPLADHLAGVDLEPERPDIWASFNAAVDTRECLGSTGWSYGTSEQAGDLRLVKSAIHELAHGLGFGALVDLETGELRGGFTPFEQNLLDLSTGLHWDEMTNRQRVLSAQSPFGLVWDGDAVTEGAPAVLAKGLPYVQVEGYARLRLVGESGFGARVPEAPLRGELTRLAARDACAGTTSLAGRVVMVDELPACSVLTQLGRLDARGASAALLKAPEPTLPPWAPDLTPAAAAAISLSSLALTAGDFEALVPLANDTGSIVELGLEPGWVGADPKGRVLMNATDPVVAGSSVSHWDRSVRRRPVGADAAEVLLMEPYDNGTSEATVSGLTVQLLHDIGWDIDEALLVRAVGEPGAAATDAGAADAGRPRGEEPLGFGSSEAGCSCRIHGGNSPPLTLGVLLALAGIVLARRRR